jgi:hypothetical protein
MGIFLNPNPHNNNPHTSIYCYHNTFLVRSNKIPSTSNAESCECLLWCFLLLCKTTTVHCAKVHNLNQPKMVQQTNDHTPYREIPIHPNSKCTWLHSFVTNMHHICLQSGFPSFRYHVGNVVYTHQKRLIRYVAPCIYLKKSKWG